MPHVANNVFIWPCEIVLASTGRKRVIRPACQLERIVTYYYPPLKGDSRLSRHVVLPIVRKRYTAS